MPNKTESILTQIIHAFSGVAGIDAIILGGSRATDTANKDSDYRYSSMYIKIE